MQIPGAARIISKSSNGDAVHYPSSDGAPMAETQVHVDLIAELLPSLRHFFRRRKNVYVAGNIFLYWEEGKPRKRRAPDIMVVKGVDASKKRLHFKTWEENAVPAFILEIISRKTAREDLGPKKEIYQSLGVGEYFLFDPLAEFLPQQFLAHRLVGGAYEALATAPDEGVISQELGIRFVPRGQRLDLFSQRNGKKLLPPEETYSELDRTKKKLEAYARRIAELEEDLRKNKER